MTSATQAKVKSAVEKALTKRASAKAPRTLVGREARMEERFRELVAWYMLQGVDEATGGAGRMTKLMTTRARIEFRVPPKDLCGYAKRLSGRFGTLY